MAKVFLHIGAHKTGTTALQSAFHKHRDRLAQFGVLYPQTNWYHFAQHRLAFGLRGLRDPVKRDVPVLSDELDALNAVIAGAASDARIFISSEEFFAARPDEVQRLKDGLGCDDVHVVAVVRKPDDLLLSIYNQGMKAPDNDFKRPLQGFLDAPTQLHRVMNQPDCLGAWVNVFGHDRMSLWTYETIEVIPDFLRLLDVPKTTITPASKVNASVPAAVLEVMRVSKVTGMEPAVRRKLFKHAQDLFANYPRLMLSGADSRRILALYERDFEALFAAFDQPNPYGADSANLDQKADRTPPSIRLYAQLVEHLLKEQ